jgi:hypothetical protein
MATPYVVLNLHEWQTRCRACRWQSAALSREGSLTEWLMHEATSHHGEGAPGRPADESWVGAPPNLSGDSRMLSTSHAFRSVLAAADLSFAAKGLLSYIVTRPPGTVITKAELFQASSDSMPTIEKAAMELVRHGLVGTVAGRGRGHRQSGGITFHPQPDKRQRMTMTGER